MKQVELSRRNFLKWSAGAVAGIALLELDHALLLEARGEFARAEALLQRVLTQLLADEEFGVD